MWLNKRHIEEGLVLKKLREITTKYNSNHKKNKYEVVKEPKKQISRAFVDENLAIKVIVVGKTTSPHNLEQDYDSNNMISF